MFVFDIAPGARLSTGDQAWVGIERASWVAAIAGLVAVIAAITRFDSLLGGQH